jgi:prepilin-type N-terminal cleavage/methylation domain-containing protein
MKKEKRRTFGFTLIELLIVISIISVLSTLGIVSYLNFSRTQLVNQAARKIAQDLRLAQSLASNNQKDKGCGDSPLVGYTFSIDQERNEYFIHANCSDQIEVKTGSVPDEVLKLEGVTAVQFKVLRQGVVTTPLGANIISVTGFGKTKEIEINAGAIVVKGE